MIIDENTSIRIKDENETYKLLIVNTHMEDNEIHELKFNTLEDIEYLEENLYQLKKKIELVQNGR